MDNFDDIIAHVKQYPEDIRKRLHLIKLLTKRGRKLSAVHHYRQALTQSIITIDDRVALGKIAKSLGLFDEAETQYIIALQKSPSDINCLIALTDMYMTRGKLNLAIPLIDKITMINPENRFAGLCGEKIIKILEVCGFESQKMNDIAEMKPSFHFPDVAFESLLEKTLQQYPKKYEPVQKRMAFIIFHLRMGGIGRKVSNIVKHLQSRKDEVEHVKLFCKSLNHHQEDSFLLPLLKESDIDVQEYSPANSQASSFTFPDIAEYSPVLQEIFQFGDEIAELTHALIQYRPQVVHGFGYQAAEFGVAAALAGVPKIVLHSGNLRPDTMSMDDNWLDHIRWVKRAYQSLAKLPNVTITNNCKNAAQDYAQWLELPADKIQVLYNGIDANSFSSKQENKTSNLRQTLGIPEHYQVVGSAFRFTEQKKPFLWLDTAELILANRPNTHFVILGNGPLLKRFKYLAKSRNLLNRFHLPGVVIDMQAWYELMDIVLLTSSMEGTSNVAIEAQWCGVPVVSTNVGGMGETLIDGKTGWLVDPPEAEGLAERVSWIMENKPWQLDAAQAAKLFVQKRFNMDTMINRILESGQGTP